MADPPTIVTCPKCAVKLKLKGDVAGKAVKCPKCATAFRIGGAKSAPPAQRSSAPTPQKSLAYTAKPARSDRTAPSSTDAESASKRMTSAKPGKPNKASSKPTSSPPRRRKTQPPREEVYDEVTYDDFDDDFGDDYGFDDGYSDSGTAKSLPSPRKKKKKNSTAKKGKGSKKSSSGKSLQDSVQSMGFPGWILSGCAAGLVAIFLTTLIGYTDIWFLIALMSLVTGTMVGGAVRFAAGDSQGWGPGLIAAVIGLSAIMAGKVGAFYVASDIFGDDEGWTIQDEIDYETSDDRLISNIADDVVDEWLEGGKITEAQIDAHFEENYEENYEDYEEGAEADSSTEYLPAVWTEAKSRWDAKSPAEQADVRAAREQEIRQFSEAAGEAGEAVVHEFRLTYAIFMAFFSLISRSGLVFFCMGVFSAFKLGSDLGTDE